MKRLTARGWVSTGTGTVCHDWLLHMFARGGRRSVLCDGPARIVSVAHKSNQDDDPAITLLREALLSALH